MTKYSSSIEDLLDDQKDEGGEAGTEEKLDQAIKDIDSKKIEELAAAKAVSAGLPYIDLEGFAISQEALSMLSEEEAKKYQIIVFFFASQELRVATTKPEQPGLQELLKKIADKYHAHVKLYLVSEASLTKALKLYARLPKTRELERGVSITAAD